MCLEDAGQFCAIGANQVSSFVTDAMSQSYNP
jgi:hypothetical protein